MNAKAGARRIGLLIVISVTAGVVMWACALGGGAPPAVLYTTPADRTATFPLSGTVIAVFNRSMDSTTITPATFLLYQGTTAIAGTVACSGNTATFQPSSPLPFGATFTATITTGAKDTSGNSLPASYVWSFTTQLTFAREVLEYTTTFIPSTFTRYGGPMSFANGGNTLSQTVNSDGSITLAITGAPGYEDNGFYFTVGQLASLNSLTVTVSTGSTGVSANLWLDSNNDGEYFAWSPAGVYTGAAGDQYFTSSSALAGTTLTIDSTTTFGGYTLAQLKAGSLAGVSGSTVAAIWVGIAVGSGSLTATITGIQHQ